MNAEVYAAPDGWRFRVKGDNGEIVAVGEAYVRRIDAEHALHRIVAGSPVNPMTATYLATLPDWKGDARVYELDPPMDDDPKQWQYVIVSAVDVMFSGPETYIFPAEKQGDVFTVPDYLELDGSFRGALDHEQALNNAGYEVR